MGGTLRPTGLAHRTGTPAYILTPIVADTPPAAVTVQTLIASLSLVSLDSSILQLSTYLPQGHLKCHYRGSKASLGDCDLGTYKLHGLLRPLTTAGMDSKTVGALSQP